MTDYPAKPQVAPQTGRIPQATGGEILFLQGVSTSELRKIIDFKKGHLFLFLVKVLEKRIRGIEGELGANLEYAKNPYLLAIRQGEIKGIREFEKIFNSVEVEYDRRVAAEEALNRDERR